MKTVTNPTMKTVLQVLEEVFENPTAPFRESWVLDFVEQELERLKVPYFKDRWNNIIAGARGASELRHSKKTALLAHTDHPGFHLEKKISKSTWTARWYGGAPPVMVHSRLAIHSPRHPQLVIAGECISKKLNSKKGNLFTIKILGVKGQGVSPVPPGVLDSNCFGTFDFPGFLKKGARIHTRAADDLAGVAIILATLARLQKKEQKHMLGIFTRAEEVGFRGTLGLIYEEVLGKENTVISLEASRQLEGARLGHGPVIRLGDRRTLFDSAVTAKLDKAAENLCLKSKKSLKKNMKVMFQRRIMNGGTCEATAFNLHGIRAGGLAIPLGNYHNQRPSGRPGAEFIDIADVVTAVDLCVEFFRLTAVGEEPTADFVKKLKTDFKKDQRHLIHRHDFASRSRAQS